MPLSPAAPPPAAPPAGAAPPRSPWPPAPHPPPEPLSKADVADAMTKLASAPMFRSCHADDLTALAAAMHKRTFGLNDLITEQSMPADHLVILASGDARRIRRGRDGVHRQLDPVLEGAAINALSVTSGVDHYSTAKCVAPSCTVYAIERRAFRKQLAASSRFSTSIIESLSDEYRVQSRRFRTPLLSQRSNNDVNVPAVAIAAATESYYRSALNSVINRQLSGIVSPFFPNMHVQVPARVSYILGFKGLRALIDRNVDFDRWSDPTTHKAVRFTATIAPGIIMTPISSVLEACNVNHIAPEPLLRRATRGFIPRSGREVIFGVGLNQLSDYFEERCRATIAPNPVIANTVGSLTAGVAAGYFSHVPHSISTLKLINPHKSYAEVLDMFVTKSVPANFPIKRLPTRAVPFARTAVACLFPRGVLVRTVQICGSFVILNGLIGLIEGDNRRRMRRALAAPAAADDSP